MPASESNHDTKPRSFNVLMKIKTRVEYKVLINVNYLSPTWGSFEGNDAGIVARRILKEVCRAMRGDYRGVDLTDRGRGNLERVRK